MKDKLNTARVGLFFLLGLAVTWIVFETLQEGSKVAADAYPIFGQFKDVKMLRSGDDVRVSGVRVGRVVQTRLKDGRAEAVLEIEKDVRLARDSVATIAISSVLGSNHVAIEMGTESDFLAAGDNIKTRHTADLNEIFAQLGDMSGRVDELFNDLGGVFTSISGTKEEPGALQNLNSILAENREALNATMENLRQITEKANQGEGTIARLLNDSSAYDSLLAAVDEIAKAAEQASSLTNDASRMMAHIQRGEGTLGALIYRDEIGREVEAVAKNLRELSDRLVNGEGTLGRLLADETLFNDLQGVIQKAERTIDGLNEQGPITAAGVAAGALF